MRILITNDDGINAPGLKVMHEIALKVAGSDGEVWIVAPESEQSGVGHCINYINPTLVSEIGERKIAIQGSPADCILAGLHYVLKGKKPDLILSGVNKGNNAGENTVYSGTVGAAMEGALQGIPSIAISQYYGPKNITLENPFEAALFHLAPLIKNIFESGPWAGSNYYTFYNINVPPTPSNAVKGIKVVSQGLRKTKFGVEPSVAPNGRNFLWIKGNRQDVPTAENTDVHANLNGYISVTPMDCDLTRYDLLNDLKKKLECNN